MVNRRISQATYRRLTTGFHERDGEGWIIRFETYVYRQSKQRTALRLGALSLLKFPSDN
jgi:hypothetical protein